MPIGRNSVATSLQQFADGGPVRRPMEHKRSESQDASTQPLTGSALKALMRGWIAGTAGLPGDIEGLARKGVNWSFGPGGVTVDEAPALPTTEFYKEWLPGKQQGDDMLNDLASIIGGVGATLPVKAAKGALSRVAAAAPGPMAGSRAAMRGVIKAPGGQWLSGSAEDALKGLKYGLPDRALDGELTPEALARVAAANNFIDKQLTRYVQKDMATERDPNRALAERGILHYAPQRPAYGSGIPEARLAAGFPASDAGTSDMARLWEKQADNILAVNPAGVYQKSVGPGWESNMWLDKTAPDVPVHSIPNRRTASQNLGFDHLMDELRNATNINSGLPTHLRLDPESLARVSVPQAVERVAKINDWRAAQKVAADQARANNAATVLHKDYPDKGFKWMELKRPDKAPEGWAQVVKSGEKPDLDRDYAYGMEALRDALKYEGDTMGHCVGGYCDDVASGKSRIYSLRDAKGQPHTTIEVTPDQSNSVRSLQANTPESFQILQIKGKGNKAPNPEYLPYVQDFVKSGKWSDVGDLQNTGLINFRGGKTHIREGGQTYGTNLDMPKGYMTAREASQFLEAQGVPTIQARRHVGDFEGLLDIKSPGYATGGTVAAPAPTWTDLYSEYTNQDWFKKQQSAYGGQIDRPWNSDDGTRQAKQTIDDNYLRRLAEYNKANGTELAPDAKMLGADAQPNDWNRKQNESGGFFGHALGAIGDTLKDPAKGLTNLSHDIAKSPIANVALTAAGAYFGLPPSLTAALLGANRTGMDGDIAAGLKTGIASYGAGKLLPDLGWGKAAQAAAGNTFSGLLGGNNIGDSLKNAGIGYIGGQAGSEVAGLTDSDFAGKAANSLTQTALKGKGIGSTLDQLATQYASGQLTDLSGMDPKMAAIVAAIAVNLARNKKGAATNIAAGALTQAAQWAVGSAKLSDRAVGA